MKYEIHTGFDRAVDIDQKSIWIWNDDPAEGDDKAYMEFMEEMEIPYVRGQELVMNSSLHSFRETEYGESLWYLTEAGAIKISGIYYHGDPVEDTWLIPLEDLPKVPDIVGFAVIATEE